ncbi:MAG: YhcH/YjgK/YiaL family protein, partial [Anaeroplasmataceae bacterium]
MIIAKLKDIKRYKGLTKNIDTAIDYVLSTDLHNLAVGKYIIEENQIHMMRESYIAKNIEDTFFETHTNYIDIQIVLKGQELFGLTDETNKTLVETTPYDPVKDIRKFNEKSIRSVKDAVWTVLEDGFVVVFPEDAHCPKVD